MSDAAALTWHQYRLERRMFWRNPTAAFFNFFLPLLFLALFGAIFAGDQENLNVIVPGIAGMSDHVDDVQRAGDEHHLPARAGRAQADARDAAADRRLPRRDRRQRGDQRVVQIAIVVVAGRLFFDIGWPKDWLELVVFVVAGVACLASLGVAWSHVIPNFDAAPAYVNIVFLPVIFISGVFYDVDNAPPFLRDIAQALPADAHHRRPEGRDGTGRGLADNLSALGGDRRLDRLVGIVLAIRGFSWESRRDA